MLSLSESTLSKNIIYKWHKLFLEGREDVNDNIRPGRPCTSQSEKLLRISTNRFNLVMQFF